MDKSLEVGGMSIENLIYEIRGKQVMLDSDLARLYGVETKRINEAVKNNPLKFPERFAFRITENELEPLKSQFTTSNNRGELALKSKFSTSNEDYKIILEPKPVTLKGGSRKGHTVFTEQGVAMLATILKSPIAIETSIAIMDAFVAMRHYLGGNEYRLANVETMVLAHDSDIKLLQESFQKFEEKKVANEVYFNGQIYDAYSKILEIFSEAKEQLIIIDMYADKTILDIIKRLKIDVAIITKPNSLLTKQDIKKYRAQYNNLRVIYNTAFHDRYFILDDETLYHCGASVNRIGYKTFSINKIEDADAKTLLISKVKTIAG